VNGGAVAIGHPIGAAARACLQHWSTKWSVATCTAESPPCASV